MRRLPFDLWQLLCVRMIAEHGSIHSAARALNTRQSNVSRSLHNLEERLGIRLFSRSPVGTNPTLFGQEFILWSQTILADVANMGAKAQRAGKGENGRISVGIQTCVLPGRFSAFSATFRVAHPDIVFHYLEGTGKRLLRRLQQNEIDFAIVTRRYLIPTLRMRPLWTDRIVVAISADHILAMQSEIFWTDLRHETFVIGRDNAGRDFEDLIYRKLGRTSSHFKIRRHDVGSNRVLALVQDQEGVALLPASWLSLIRNQDKNIIIAEIRDENGPSHLEFNIIWQQENKNPSAQYFSQYVEFAKL